MLERNGLAGFWDEAWSLALRVRTVYAAYLEIAETFSLRTTARIVATNLEINSALSEKRFNAIPIRHFASGKPSSWNRTPGTREKFAGLLDNHRGESRTTTQAEHVVMQGGGSGPGKENKGLVSQRSQAVPSVVGKRSGSSQNQSLMKERPTIEFSMENGQPDNSNVNISFHQSGNLSRSRHVADFEFDLSISLAEAQNGSG